MQYHRERYQLQKPAYYRKQFDGSHRLFTACWNQYRAWLKGAIDDPTSDNDVISWLDQIASEKVNNPRSTYFIHG